MQRLAILFLLTACADRSAPGESMQVVRVVRDLLADPPAWEVVRARADGAPLVEVVSPSVNGLVDGADMPALVLAPPAEVRFELGKELVPVRLVSRCGVGQLAFTQLSDEIPEASVVFEVLAAGRSLAREVVHMKRGEHARNCWLDLGGSAGIEISAAAAVTLRTEALLPDGTRIDPPVPVQAGFGGLRLERSQQRARTRSSPAQPNVVLIVMDTLRADRLSAYGYASRTSPRLEALAARGVLFQECQSTASWTWPATASILTGLTPMEHGLSGEGSSYLLDQTLTVAEVLQAAGFTTAAWSGNPIVTPSRNLDQGFEEFHDAPGDFRKTGEFFDEVRAFLRARAGTRFFLYLHLAEPHNPLVPLDEGARLLAADVPAGFGARSDALRTHHEQAGERAPGPADVGASAEERRWLGELYDACVWSGDHWLGEVMAELDALGLADETLVAFTADHGEELLERGFLGHGQSLHRELVHVPLVVAGPGVPSGERRTALLSNRLVGPLLAALCGVPFADADEALHRLGHDERGEPVVFATTKGWWKGQSGIRLVGMTDGEWKLDLVMEGAQAGAPGGELELFHLSADPLEQAEVSASHPAEVARLRALLLERVRELEARRVGPDFRAAGATLLMLRRLGYGGDER